MTAGSICAQHKSSKLYPLTYCAHLQGPSVWLSQDFNLALLPPQLTPLSWLLLIGPSRLLFFIPQSNIHLQVKHPMWLIFMFFVFRDCHVILFLIRATRLCHDSALSWATLSSGFYLQSIVQDERANEYLEIMLQYFSSASVFLVWAECELNSLQSSVRCEVSEEWIRCFSSEGVCLLKALERALTVFLSARLHQVHQVNEWMAITVAFSSKYYRNCLLSIICVGVVS